jgi:uncharacterized protein with ParB-like and HNH nuclease domain
MKDVKSKILSLNEICELDHFYNIPIYQRLYVWETEQINTLLEDLLTACLLDKPRYYLGGILTVKSPADEREFDLIDGQQRFTTLWLLSLELGGDMEQFMENNEELRLRFSIRENVTEYFTKIKQNKEVSKELFTDSSLSRINEARSTIQGFLENRLNKESITKKQLSSYIYTKLQLMITEVPSNTDLNKLFELTNNRGVQLQQHEILKAKLLKHFDNKARRLRYSKIWNACAEMNLYIEKSLALETGLRNQDIAGSRHEHELDLKRIFKLLKHATDSKREKTYSLSEVLKKKSTDSGEALSESDEEKRNHPNEQEDERYPVRSILSFPQLLLHTLRIYLIQSGEGDIKNINEKELLKTFDDSLVIESEKKVKDFMELLFDVRIAFDKHIIKWVQVSKQEEIHQVKPLKKYNEYRRRTYYLSRIAPDEKAKEFALLQSMLYHSQQITTQFWLTPFLLQALKEDYPAVLHQNFKVYDNWLFCSLHQGTLGERTFDLAKRIWNDEEIEYELDFDIWDSEEGVGFWHYYFYKLEYILWDAGLYEDKADDDGATKGFKITAKNSVEHVSPQTKKYEKDTVSEKNLNRIGNLALVSRSLNSSLSNKGFGEKRESYNYNNLKSTSSLKLELIFKNEHWSDELCENHAEVLKQYCDDYFASN